MSRLSLETVWRRIVLDAHQRAKIRLAEFAYIVPPSLNLMRRLLSAKTTPRWRLMVAETRAYSRLYMNALKKRHLRGNRKA